MPYEFKLPTLSSETEEGIVVAWFKREDAEVKEGENLLEVQLAKVSYDVPAPITGRLYKILAPREAVIRAGQVLALFLQPGEQAPAAEPASAPPAAASAPAAAAAAPTREVRASPIARRLAQEHGLDLSTVHPSNSDGRITEADVRAALEAAQARDSGTKTERLSPMRQTIARRMTESLRTAAQLTLEAEADVTELVALRERLNAQFDVSYTDLIVRAVSLALAENPALNSRLVGDQLERVPEMNIGIAVALGAGLVAPVLRATNRKNLRQLAAEARELANRAREGKLTEEEMSGGTFTVTNLGAYGIDAFTPIINLPEVAILGVGRISEKPVHRDGQLQWRRIITLSLTIDHRAIDGAPGAAFLQTLRAKLENPAQLE